ncbi:MAG: hypothetical protein V4671_17990 [Armatimonadota bacterium]
MNEFLSVSEMLSQLGFADEWWQYGFLDETSLRYMFDQFQSSDDKNREHYRYGAFRRSLELSSLTERPEFIEQYMILAQLDPDRGMAKSALESLLRSWAIPIEQVKSLRVMPEFSDHHLQAAAERREIIAAINDAQKATQPSSELFCRCIAASDSSVQHSLLQRLHLDNAQLEALKSEGVTCAIRNIATSQLKRRLKL